MCLKQGAVNVPALSQLDIPNSTSHMRHINPSLYMANLIEFVELFETDVEPLSSLGKTHTPVSPYKA